MTRHIPPRTIAEPDERLDYKTWRARIGLSDPGAEKYKKKNLENIAITEPQPLIKK